MASYLSKTNCTKFGKIFNFRISPILRPFSFSACRYSDDSVRKKIEKRPRPSSSMMRWTDRQHKDPYVKQRPFDNYRARSAYKLLEIDDRFGILHPGMILVDCGAAPGSWSQVLTQRAPSNESNKGKIIAVDLLHMEAIEGVIMLGNSDFMNGETRENLARIIGNNSVDGVLCDISPNVTGNHKLDHERIVDIAYGVLAFAAKNLNTNFRSFFLCKLFQGSESQNFLADVKKFFRQVALVKPDASRSESSEIYILGRQFKGVEKT